MSLPATSLAVPRAVSWAAVASEITPLSARVCISPALWPVTEAVCSAFVGSNGRFAGSLSRTLGSPYDSGVPVRLVTDWNAALGSRPVTSL